MAITGSYIYSGVSLAAAYCVIDSIDFKTASAYVVFKIYSSVSAYEIGAAPVDTYPMSISYNGSTVPLDTFEEYALTLSIFSGFTRVTTAVVSVPAIPTRPTSLVYGTTATAGTTTDTTATTSSTTTSAT